MASGVALGREEGLGYVIQLKYYFLFPRTEPPFEESKAIGKQRAEHAYHDHADYGQREVVGAACPA